MYVVYEKDKADKGEMHCTSHVSLSPVRKAQEVSA